ncbi:amino acid permease [Burkholderia sp. LAS2]|uniref:amino acid permease n=1 Tax=Burkholderia sp. LAS2 TaxID=2813843 RepID=UPI001BCAC6A4|nr:amino acid permease [Burkholderia sp. LAS2]QVN11305.1 amino acid permease [Burkholderia sp. LAS2]
MDAMQAATDTAAPSGTALKRRLQGRHVAMIAIGGSIGTGLFVASGASVAQAGPGGAIAAYIAIGVMVYFVVTGLGEMAALMPVSGSFAIYGEKYVDEGFGVALGWTYWYSWAVTIAIELVAAQIVMRYWFPSVPGVWWGAGFLVLIFLLNTLSVRGFGESEYWFSLIKVVTVIAFIAAGLLIAAGVLGGGHTGSGHTGGGHTGTGHPVGWRNFTTGDAPFVGGVHAMMSVALIAGFSFLGTELVGITAGESENPRKTIPRAVKQIFWRIMLFYVLAIFVIGLLVPYTDPNLLKSDVTDIGVSPFTLVFSHAGFPLAAGAMNLVILTAVLSAGNSGTYAATRMLYNLASEGRAPAMFATLSPGGVPRNALYATMAVGGLCFLTSLTNNQRIYLWLLNTVGITGFIAWLGIAVCHYRFRRGFLKQGYRLDQLPYRAKWFPFGPVFAVAVCIVISLGQDYQAFFAARIDWMEVLSIYVWIPLFVAIWWAYRRARKSRLVRYEEMDIGPWLTRSVEAVDAAAAQHGQPR